MRRRLGPERGENGQRAREVPTRLGPGLEPRLGTLKLGAVAPPFVSVPKFVMMWTFSWLKRLAAQGQEG